MQCGICEKDFGARRKAHCASCARAVLYKSRVEQASALLDREKWHTHVEAITRPGNDGVLAALPVDADWDSITTGIKAHSLEGVRIELAVAGEKIKGIAANADRLRQTIESYKASVEKKKASNQRRRQQLSLEREQLEKRKLRARESVQAAVMKSNHRLGKLQKRAADARELLCGEVASLSGLHRITRDDGKTEYHLAGVMVPDLRDLNGINGRIRSEIIDTTTASKPLAETHEIVSAAFDNVCRLVGIACHYLSVRLPSEVILPHNDFPHAAVVPRGSSYQSNNPRYPVSLSSRSSSPVASRILQRSDLSRPRLLCLDRPLPQLQKEEPKTAMLFLEAVTLLAYDVAWLCRSQGMDDTSSFADICAIGQNLHHLFYGKDEKKLARPLLIRAPSSATTITGPSATPGADGVPSFGLYSHGSAHHSLAGHQGASLFTSDSFPVRQTRLTDQLKSYLRQETARAEWHFIDETEWDEQREDERAVLVGGSRALQDPNGPAMSVLSVRPSDGTDEANLPVRERGSRGWMKVRGRDGAE
ncbi:UV radiation resistance protein and autophagy-related subunit 14-domain-containing protein [Neohortaea acidophila]|uniref:Autophagy-related protein 14 n=1 Tax=Neohortaea acidophila TaxID=245834 RepID=A0A6A6PRX1_9PEZI|nr:UV radiation resistance protein and autophagy-related subunit 14-domain-containing protein [Neohortaea acidophila]KAF2482223.1 UV radiation resistance protein and autophagy-related subunit 14-domain-containing protein [Neohortaea acidophila]